MDRSEAGVRGGHRAATTVALTPAESSTLKRVFYKPVQVEKPAGSGLSCCPLQAVSCSRPRATPPPRWDPRAWPPGARGKWLLGQWQKWNHAPAVELWRLLERRWETSAHCTDGPQFAMVQLNNFLTFQCCKSDTRVLGTLLGTLIFARGGNMQYNTVFWFWAGAAQVA